ncbi:DUF664 domain-containing protein [Dactylosporangium vinaceum]|uniref:DUF664 domain-containing protein n=1 Tax=Dactylosporangium vinaceum TaxID=53362 RepID=A0ABV5MMH3_9ACTN|nr:DUF664 domain-containing protein [Dactylosporangium vinaceum]UAB93242.1 DUF664 domain-containing protein [Dactylosporangium vinaceum]
MQEPKPDAGETELLLFALERSRAQFAWKTGGLDAAALARPLPPSTMTLGGLLKHLAAVEERYAVDFTGRPPGPPLDNPEALADTGWVWRSATNDEPAQLYSLWHSAVARSRAAMQTVLAAEGALDRPAEYTRYDSGEYPNLRRILVDLHDEYARHVGHADLLREAIDGLVGDDPPA